jgi:glutaredoxin
MAAKKVTLYTTNDPYSVLARNYLIKNGIDFEEIDATKEEGWSSLIKLTKQSRTPFLYIKHSSSISSVVGFGEFQYASAIDPN